MKNPFSQKTHPNCWRGHNYAQEVVDGKVVACIYTIAACKRYLTDISNDYHPTFFFDKEKAERYLRLVQRFEHVIGKGWKTKNITYEPWQCWVWMNIMGFMDRRTGFRRFRTAHIEIARGNAKLHSLDTPVPTPDGMKVWKDIEVGSRLYDRNGGICRVIGKTPIHSPQMYEIEFSDGEKLKVSDKHLWFTSTKVERSREVRHRRRPPGYSSAVTFYESVRETREIAKSLKAGKESNHSIKNAKPIVGEKKKLPIDPYVLGYWLGNGSASADRIHCHVDDSDEVMSLFSDRGYPPTDLSQKEGNGFVFGASGLLRNLKGLGVIDDKTIPEEYFLSSIEDRQELVRGLLDSDGTINPATRGQVTFTAKRKNLADGMARLLYSLGYKISRRQFKVSEKNNFKSDSVFFGINFYPRGQEFVFNLKRKRDLQIFQSGKHSYVGQRYIVGCRKLKSKHPGFCVEVDSSDNSYLIGEGHIPTHNSAMASQATLYFAFLDEDREGNQVACAATKKDQARIVLDSARNMAKKNQHFLRKNGVEVLAHTIRQESSNSIVRAISSDKDSLDGLQDILSVLDELHAVSRPVYNAITSGTAKRSDSLTLCITTAGVDIDSVGYSQSEYAKKVATGEFPDDTFFAAVYTLDEKDDPWDEAMWPKANPNWGISVDPIKFKAMAEKAKRVPADAPGFKIKNLNLWDSEEVQYFSLRHWDACADPTLKIEDFLGKRSRLAIDLASKRDLTSDVQIFYEAGTYYMFDRNYLPEARLKEVGREIFASAVESGELIATPGETINNDLIRENIEKDAKRFRIAEGAFDPWNANEMAQKLQKTVEMVEFKMNVANLSEPMKKLDELIRNGKFKHKGSKLFRWCLGNVVAKLDSNENVFPRKTHERFKIDPVIAAIMALALWLQDNHKESIYETRGMRSIKRR